MLREVDTTFIKDGRIYKFLKMCIRTPVNGNNYLL